MAYKFMKFGSAFKNDPLYIFIVSLFLELMISFFLDEGQVVPGDKVLLYPGFDN